MRQSDVYKVNVPELGDRSDITVVSDAILSGEKNTIGNVQWMKATNSGNVITLTSETRTAKMSKYYNGLAVQFVSPINVTSSGGIQIKVDNLEAQPFTTTNDIEVGNVVCAVYSASGFTANKMGVAVIDNLTTADSKKALSANQGKVLNEKKADKTIQIIAGNGLTGGGDLNANRTLNVASANDGITANADNIQLNTVDNLTTTSTTKPLSANQGKILNDKMATLTNVANGKLDKGSLPETIKNAKDLYDLLENNGGLAFDTNCMYIQESKQKTVGHVYFDRNTKGIFECYKTAPASVVINDAQYFRDISNKANSDRLANLDDRLGNLDGTVNNLRIYRGKYVFAINAPFSSVMENINFSKYLSPTQIYLIVFESSYRTGSALLLPIYSGENSDSSFRSSVMHFDEKTIVFLNILMHSNKIEIIGDMKSVSRIIFYEVTLK